MVNVSFDNISLCSGGGGGENCEQEPVVNGDFAGGNVNWVNWVQRGTATRNFSSAVTPTGGGYEAACG